MALQHVVIMGVSGSGKSTVGKLLAQKLGATFIDADSLHSAANVAKMEAGIPLDDADRKPWLELVGKKFTETGETSVVIACSALKRSYRDIIRRADPTVRFVLLHGARELLAERITKRRDHFMPASMLDSQLQTLEPLQPDESGFTLNIAKRPEELAIEAADRLHQFGDNDRCSLLVNSIH